MTKARSRRRMIQGTAGGDSGGVGSSAKSGSDSSRLEVLFLAALAAIGLGVAGYLTVVHYAPTLLVCSASGFVNCEAVLTSAFSVVPGTSIPITVPGLGFFLVSLALAIAQLRRPANYGLRQAHAVWAGLGLLTIFYLIFVEFVELRTICLWCTSVHVVILLTFLLTLWRLYPKPSVRQP